MASLRGRVIAGRGVASEHISGASDELEIIIGERPFPGTLNLLLDKPTKLKEEAATYFDGGERLLWPARMNGTLVWLYRWIHAPLHVAEVIAAVPLRDQFGLSAGSEIELEVSDSLFETAPTVSWSILWKGREKHPYASDRYNRAITSVSRKTSFGIEPLHRAIPKTLRRIVRKLMRRPVRPYRFSRVKTDAVDGAKRDTAQVFNLLNYTKTSNTDYSARKYPAGYHSIDLGNRKLAGQRDPATRLAQVPIDFAGKSVLDIGSNQGGMLLQVADRIKWGVGVDFDHRMVNAANRIKTIKGAPHLNFYVFDLQKEDLQIIRDFLPEPKADVCFLLSVCMWLSNWREVIEFAASIADSLVFESNGSVEEQAAQIEHLGRVFRKVMNLADESPDDPGQRRRKLLLASR